MPPGRRPVPTEDERRIAEKEARFRALVEAGLTKTTVPGPGLSDAIGRAILEPVLQDLFGEMSNEAIWREGTQARINAVQQPIDYYKDLPGMKRAVLADMAMGIQRSADAEEGIREQRMANAPYAFPTDWANQQVGTYADVVDENGSPILMTPYEVNPGVTELPRFIIGEISQENLSNRRALPGQYGQLGSNWQDEVLRQLKPGQAILVRSNDLFTDDSDVRYGYQAPLMIVAKDENNMLYQREINQEQYDAFKESMRSGYPAGIEQLIIDEIASRSQMPRVRQDEVFSDYPYGGRPRQLNYLEPETMSQVSDNVAGFVTTSQPRGITLLSDYIPKKSMILRALLEKGINASLTGNPPEQEGAYVLSHEQGHTWDFTSPEDERLSTSDEYANVMEKDSVQSARYLNNFIPFSDAPTYLDNIILGDTYASVYGKNNGPVEDFAERQALWSYSNREGGLGTTKDGEVVTFEDLFPNSAAYFEKIRGNRYGR